ncbi:MAG: AraC family transcriptional regulator [Burkholderiaceae bacterium]|nr:AraC family transcriptional regulator [Burkholderiaceae bacterium]
MASDPLSHYLQTLQLRASIYASPEVCGRWRVNPTVTHPGPGFHLVAYGQGWLHLKDGSPPLRFHEGDLLVFPRGAWHVLSAEPEIERRDSYTDAGPAGSGAGLVCGQLMFAARTQNPVLDALPDVLVLPTRGEANAALLGPLTALLAAEASNMLPGRGVILDRLAEVLFVSVLRHAVQTGLIRGGILGALTDARLGRALAAFHRAPGQPWRLSELAAAAGVSRSVFSDQFQQLVGIAPMQYVTHWRMETAAICLRTSNESVAQVAAAFGYQAEASFRRAFKRHHGIGPGAVRRDEPIPDHRDD